MKILILILSFILLTTYANADLVVKGNIHLKKNNQVITKDKNWKDLATKKIIVIPNSISDIEQKQKKLK